MKPTWKQNEETHNFVLRASFAHPKLFLGPVKSRSELALKTKLETAQKMPETQNKNVKDCVEA